MNEFFAIHVTGPLTVRTESSVWLLRGSAPGGRYVRMPTQEAPRRPTPATDDALEDLTWHDYRAVFVVRHADGDQLRIIPADRPSGSQGITTGMIVAASPALDSLRASEGGTGRRHGR